MRNRDKIKAKKTAKPTGRSVCGGELSAGQAGMGILTVVVMAESELSDS